MDPSTRKRDRPDAPFDGGYRGTRFDAATAGDDDVYGGAVATPIRWSSLPPDEKLAKRKEERNEKKQRERQLQYFVAVAEAVRALQAQAKARQDANAAGGGLMAVAGGSVDGEHLPTAETASAGRDYFHSPEIADALDGFCTEFSKCVKSNPTLLRHSAVCRALEQVLTGAERHHLESIMYVLLGVNIVEDLMLSPTASYVFETLLAAIHIACCVNHSAEHHSNGGSGMEVSGRGGMPPLEELLETMVERILAGELSSATADVTAPPHRAGGGRPAKQPAGAGHAVARIVYNRCGAKAYAALILTLAGVATKHSVTMLRRLNDDDAASVGAHAMLPARAPARLVYDPMDRRLLRITVMAALDACEAPPPDVEAPGHVSTWASEAAGSGEWTAVNAACHASATFVVQASFRAAFAHRGLMPKLTDRLQALYLDSSTPAPQALVAHPIGSFVVEAAVATGDVGAWQLLFESVTERRVEADVSRLRFAVTALCRSAPSEPHLRQLWSGCFMKQLPAWLSGTPGRPTDPAAVKDVDPTTLAAPHVAAATAADQSAPLDALIVFCKRAMALPQATADKAKSSSSSHDASGVALAASIGFRREVGEGIMAALRGIDVAAQDDAPQFAEGHEYGAEGGGLSLRPATKKGPAHMLVVLGMPCGVQGWDLCDALLHFGRTASSALVNSFEKIPIQDLDAIPRTAAGSKVMQTLVTLLAQPDPTAAKLNPSGSTAPQPSASTLKKGSSSGGGTALSVVAATTTTSNTAKGRMNAAAAAKRKLEQIEKKKLGKSNQVAAVAKKSAVVGPQRSATPLASVAASGSKSSSTPAQAASALVATTQFARFYRRVAAFLVSWSRHPTASFLVEKIYLTALDAALKEDLVKKLSEVYLEAKSDFYFAKVALSCNVEQFRYRPDEWRAIASRTAHVRELMSSILAAE